MMKNARGAALIIVIFAMLLFAVLGWTLANLQTGDFEANLRNLDSGQALSLAEGGAQWALNQLSQNSGWRTTTATDCADSADWMAAPHNFSPGQYNVCCRNPVSGTETGDAVIEARGFVPAQDNYRARREVRLMVQAGGLSNAIMTPPANPADAAVGLFNWWPVIRDSHTIQVEGNIYAGHYRGDNDINDDEPGQDYDGQPAPILPQGFASPADEQRGFSTAFPDIDMQWLYDNANTRWPNPSSIPLTATVANVVNGGTSPGYVEVSTNNFFNNMNNQAIKLNVNDWYGTNNWRQITQVVSGTRARLDQPVAWQIGNTVKLIRRIYQNENGGGGGDIWYVGGQKGGGETTDTLIDVRSGNVRMSNIYLICEGDIVIKGADRLLVRFISSVNQPRHPSLGTEYGDIISTDTPSGAADSDRMNRRQIAGLIYSQFGLVDLNYLQPPEIGSSNFRGNLVYGNQITFGGQIYVNYLPNLITSSGSFNSGLGILNWSEQ